MDAKQTLELVYRHITAAKVSFFVAFFVIVTITYAILVLIDFIPEPVTTDETAAEMTDEVAAVAPEVVTESEPDPEPESDSTVDPLPTKIIFDSLDKEVTVLNPTSRTVADLDAALLSGVVRHPDSADFAETGNIFILGHSSYLPNVLNKNFQAFNGIQKLDWGDTVRLQSGDREYVYRVDTVYQAKASEVVVPIDGSKERLTLATCNSFGSTDDRFMVEATLVNSYVI